MTVNTTISSQRFTGNGVTVAWPFNFKFFANSDIQAVVITPLGVETALTLGPDYSLTGSGTAMGGTLTTTVPVANLDTLVVSRILVPNQLTDLRNQGEFFPEIHEDIFDRLTMLVQQALNNNGQALLFPLTDAPGLSKTLPIQASRASRVMAFDAIGQPIASNLTLDQLEQQPVIAAAAAAAAAQSATDADIARAAAEGFATSAQGSAASATASASLAEKWANEAVDVPVLPGLYSAFHWAQKTLATLASLTARVLALENIGKPFTKEYTSTAQAIVSGGLVTLNHGLGTEPKLVRVSYVCVVAGNGFSVGDVVEPDGVGYYATGGSTYGKIIIPTSTQLTIRHGQSLLLLNKGTGLVAQPPLSDFNIIVRAWA